MRTLESAIESYATDHGAYPPSTFDKNFQLNWQYSEDGSTFDRRVLLSTPIPYILSYPTDFLFSEEEPQSNFGYWTNGDLFIIYSPSPDKKIDLDMREFENIFNRENAILAPSTQTLLTTSALQYLETHAFDPSNGSESSGDIFYNSALFK